MALPKQLEDYLKLKQVMRNEKATRQIKELAVPPQMYGFSTLLFEEPEDMLRLQEDV
jgi:hypothetical protein